MSGETHLATLLNTLQPDVSAEEYVFVSVSSDFLTDSLSRNALSVFKEDEGITLILERQVADAEGLTYAQTFKRITCHVHSSLDAVGMTAAMSAALTEAGISANVVAAYYHDHIFVPANHAQNAQSVLLGLADTA